LNLVICTTFSKLTHKRSYR